MRPEWLRPVEEGAREISVHDLTRFMPPEDSDPRRGAVLILFGESPAGPDLLLTERAHHMRSHPGQISFPGGSIDPGETPLQAALREAEEETGLDPAQVRVVAESVEDHGGWSYTTVVAEADALLHVHSEDRESTEVRWVLVEDVLGLPLHPSFGAAWPHLRSRLPG